MNVLWILNLFRSCPDFGSFRHVPYLGNRLTSRYPSQYLVGQPNLCTIRWDKTTVCQLVLQPGEYSPANQEIHTFLHVPCTQSKQLASNTRSSQNSLDQ